MSPPVLTIRMDSQLMDIYTPFIYLFTSHVLQWIRNMNYCIMWLLIFNHSVLYVWRFFHLNWTYWSDETFSSWQDHRDDHLCTHAVDKNSLLDVTVDVRQVSPPVLDINSN
jgi:hypothetical protein